MSYDKYVQGKASKPYGLWTWNKITSFKESCFFEWTNSIWTQLPETALANQSELWGNLSLWARWFWFQFTNLFRKHWFAVRVQSLVNVRESPSHPNGPKQKMILSHPPFDAYRFSKFDPCAIHKVPMAWWSSCRCTRKAIHNQILALMRMATNATSCRDSAWIPVIRKNPHLVWLPTFTSFFGLRFWVQFPKYDPHRKWGSDMALWYYDMKGTPWMERWSFVFPDPKWGATWAHNPHPINVSIDLCDSKSWSLPIWDPPQKIMGTYMSSFLFT